MDKPKNLLFPTDFSPASAKALPFAVQLARASDILLEDLDALLAAIKRRATSQESM